MTDWSAHVKVCMRCVCIDVGVWKIGWGEFKPLYVSPPSRTRYKLHDGVEAVLNLNAEKHAVCV